MSDIATINEFSISKIFKSSEDRYVVPLYQREYAWGKTEIERLLNDLYIAFKTEPPKNYYLGSFVVVNGTDNRFELIDGQQRLITFSILYPLFLSDASGGKKILDFECREEADKFLAKCYECGTKVLDAEGAAACPEPFVVAANVMNNFYPEGCDEDVSKDCLQGQNPLKEPKAGTAFKQFILDKVRLFRIELPSGTDVNAYFEIMNNRGEQLEYHEILKAELISKLETQCKPEGKLSGRNFDELASRFDTFWTACSRLNGHLIDHLHCCWEFVDNPNKTWLDVEPKKNDEESPDDNLTSEQSVLWDFSNFLMHALRCYRNDNFPNIREEIPLDERKMKEISDSMKSRIDPVSFLDLLIRLRLKFDKYVVKSFNDDRGYVIDWQLTHVKHYDRSYEAVNTFGPDVLPAIVYFQSMLQVTYNTQRNKEWLQMLLEAEESELSDGETMLRKLKDWTRVRLEGFKTKIEKADKNIYCLGLETSRLMLNLIDYLMWEKRNENAEFPVDNKFVFKYLTSIEHHHPQNDKKTGDVWGDKDKNDIGNLFLVYSSENSSMSNSRPYEKKKQYLNAHNQVLPDCPKRRWMYDHTSDIGSGWSLSDMEKLSNYVKGLLDSFLSEGTESTALKNSGVETRPSAM